jgi:hypothetical protein
VVRKASNSTKKDWIIGVFIVQRGLALGNGRVRDVIFGKADEEPSALPQAPATGGVGGWMDSLDLESKPLTRSLELTVDKGLWGFTPYLFIRPQLNPWIAQNCAGTAAVPVLSLPARPGERAAPNATAVVDTLSQEELFQEERSKSAQAQ